jgi:hypothetical protein
VVTVTLLSVNNVMQLLSFDDSLTLHLAYCFGTKILTEESGTFTSNTGPTYAESSNCVWDIRPDGNTSFIGNFTEHVEVNQSDPWTSIVLSFTAFSLELDQAFVKVYDVINPDEEHLIAMVTGTLHMILLMLTRTSRLQPTTSCDQHWQSSQN